MFVVYKHTTPTGKVYIGITSRKPEHRWNHGNGYKGNKHFQRAIQLYGWDNIEHEILASGLTHDQACALEIRMIAKYDSTNPQKGYNHSTGGDGATGVHPSEETRKKMSELRKGRRVSEETRKRLSDSLKGHVYSEETRKKISESSKGKTISKEQRSKISNALKGRIGPNQKTVICVETGAKYSSISQAAMETGLNRGHISEVCNGRLKKTGGFHWKYAQQEEEKPC